MLNQILNLHDFKILAGNLKEGELNRLNEKKVGFVVPSSLHCECQRY